MATMWCPEGREAEIQGWDMENVRDNCKVDKVFGTINVPLAARLLHFEGIREKPADLHEAIYDIGDPAIKLVLKRQCADVGKVIHVLRAGGDELDEALYTSGVR